MTNTLRHFAKHLVGSLFGHGAPAGLLLAAAFLGAAVHAGELSFDTIFDEELAERAATVYAWAPDGTRLAYQWEDDQGDALWILDLEQGSTRRLVTVGTAGLDEVSEPRWAPDGRSLVMVSGGDLFLIDAAGDEKIRRLTETEAKEEDPKFSPGGDRVAFVRDYDLVVVNLASGAERMLTSDGEENRILNATTDWVYWEEIWGREATGYWWSPEGDKIAYYRFDESDVKSYPLVDFTTQYPTVTWQKYPKAGETNPAVRVGVIDLATAATTWLDTGRMDDASDVYLARVDWRPSGDRIAIQRLNRDQNRLDLLLCEPDDGACSTLLTETSSTWVNLTKDLRFLEDNRFLWTSEATGHKALGVYSSGGELVRDLTPPDWTIDELLSVTESGSVFYTAYRSDSPGALHRVVFRQEIEGGEAAPASPISAWNTARVASTPKDHRLALATSTAETPTEVLVLDATGEELARLPRRNPAYDPASLPAWEFLTIPNPDGSSLPAALIKPAGFDPARTYPAIMYHYGGPASQVVADRWAGKRNLWHKLMAERGYVILMVDNLGSNFFGKAGADRLHRRFGEVNLAAQRAGAAYLAALGFVDAERIGLWGWSGGGSNTLYSLLNSPGTWRAGVAGAPVTDWRFYDTIWTERYLDHPDDNPDGYQDSSAITHVAKLTDKLLIVHGTADDNVHPQNTLAMAQRLIAAGIPFEDAIHPRQKHGFRGVDARHFYERMTSFFDRHLAPAHAHPAGAHPGDG